MKPKFREILEMCIEQGIAAGYNKAHKHTDNPTENEIKNQILHYINLQISEYFTYEDSILEL